MPARWTSAQAWEWHKQQPWLRGCNFMGSDCCNRVDQWQEHGFEKRFATTDRELALAASIGFNSIRLILQFEVWDQEHDGFLQRFERTLQCAHSHGISAMICFGNDCTVPKNDLYKPIVLGEQHVDWGYHGGRKNSPHSGYQDAIGYSILDDAELAPRFFAMVEEIISIYAHDPRVVVWDLFNEPGNGNRGEVSVPHVTHIFEVAQGVNPMQPITSGIWHSFKAITLAEKVALQASDVVSYHNYGSFDSNILIIDQLRELGRPLLNTEWLNRITHNELRELLPLFFLEKIGCYNWGFVAGLYQTYEPWEGLWKQIDAGRGGDIDVTRWQHDLFRPSHRPYDPREIAVIRKYCQLANEKQPRTLS